MPVFFFFIKTILLLSNHNNCNSTGPDNFQLYFQFNLFLRLEKMQTALQGKSTSNE